MTDKQQEGNTQAQGVDWPLSVLRAGHWREVHPGRPCMKLEVTYERETWNRLMAVVEAALSTPASHDAQQEEDDSTDYRCPDCGKLNYKPLGCANCGYELLVQQPGVAGERVHDVIENLLQLAYRAWCLADDTEDSEHGLTLTCENFDALSAELDKLDALPDDQPGYTMEAAAKARWALRGLFAALSPAATPANGGAQ